MERIRHIGTALALCIAHTALPTIEPTDHMADHMEVELAYIIYYQDRDHKHEKKESFVFNIPTRSESQEAKTHNKLCVRCRTLGSTDSVASAHWRCTHTLCYSCYEWYKDLYRGTVEKQLRNKRASLRSFSLTFNSNHRCDLHPDGIPGTVRYGPDNMACIDPKNRWHLYLPFVLLSIAGILTAYNKHLRNKKAKSSNSILVRKQAPFAHRRPRCYPVDK